jgi:hypothetical protein
MLKRLIDQPFRSKEEIESEQALVSQYRELGNAELLAAADLQRQDKDEELTH